MKSHPEKDFYNRIKKLLPGDVSRVENIADDGTPDVTAAYGGVDYWVETKVCDNIRDVRPVNKLLRKSQIVWHMRRVLQGSHIYTLVEYPKFMVAYKAMVGHLIPQEVAVIARPYGKALTEFIIADLKGEFNGIRNARTTR